MIYGDRSRNVEKQIRFKLSDSLLVIIDRFLCDFLNTIEEVEVEWLFKHRNIRLCVLPNYSGGLDGV